ncbi:MAG: helix-turn-helix transcriptional regulator [Clostridia bacterium]|nr:helix-turn-helix transcriptional regulator [Clostridia bacterium]MBR2176705.1 helix-turn-helix transcriptional regulator [Clostridia bacterium]
MYSMISYWLKYYRHECGLTQQQVADRLKIERSTYTYYETGKTKPDINTLIKIAKVYNINYTQLLQGVEDELEAAVAEIHSGPADEDSLKYRTHATTKYEVELLFVVRNLNPKQRKEVMNLAKQLVNESEANK